MNKKWSKSSRPCRITLRKAPVLAASIALAWALPCTHVYASEPVSTNNKKYHLDYTPNGNGGSLSMTTNNVNAMLQWTHAAGASGVRGAIVGGTKQFTLGGDITYSKNIKSAFLAAGFGLTEHLNGIFTASGARQNAASALGNANYLGMLSARSFSAALNYDHSFIRFLNEQGNDAQLSTSQKITSTSTHENLSTYLLNKTITTTTTTSTYWNAFNRRSLLVGMHHDMGGHVQSTMGVGISKDPFHQTMWTIETNLGYYAGSWKSFVSLDYRQKLGARYGIGLSHAMGSNFSFTADVHRVQPINNQAKAVTEGRIGLAYTFGNGVARPFLRPTVGAGRTAQQIVADALQNNSLHVRPAELGRVNVVTTQKEQTTQTETPIPAQALDKSQVQISVDPVTGNITISIPARSGWKYQYQVDNGTWMDVVTGASGSSGSSMQSKGLSAPPQSITNFTIAALEAGEHTIALREVNPRDGKAGSPVSVTVSTFKDAPTLVATSVVNATFNTAVKAWSISDSDGIKDYSCRVMNGSTQVGSIVQASGNTCSFKDLPADTLLELVETAMVAVKNRDGTLTYSIKEARTPFRTAVAPDTQAPVITLNGINTVTLVQGGTYTEPGASCTDNKDATCNVVITGSVNTAVVGTNTITYTATDSAGNVQTATRVVNITAPTDTTAPSLTSSSNLSSANIWASESHTLSFDESVNSFTLGSLPTGISVSVSGSWASRTLNISTWATFTSFGSVTIPFTVQDATWNSRSLSVTKSIVDVAPSCNQTWTVNSVNDDWSSIPSYNIATVSCTDVIWRTLNYSLSILSQTGWSFTWPATMSINSSWAIKLNAIDANWPVTVNYKWTVTPQWSTSSASWTDTINIVDTI